MSIFISYRRTDSSPTTGRIWDALKQEFGERNVFYDMENIAGGEKFLKVIEEAVQSSEVVLVVIGKRWIKATNSEGQRRLDAPNDYVRYEIETALQNNKYIIPLLIDGVQMPSSADLPISICGLTEFNAMEIHNDKTFPAAIQSLIKLIKKRQKKRIWLAPAIISIYIFITAFALLRNNIELVAVITTVFVMLAIAGAISYFQRRTHWAIRFLSLVSIFAITLFLFFLVQPIKDIAIIAFLGSPTPTPVATSTPGATNTPTATLTSTRVLVISERYKLAFNRNSDIYTINDDGSGLTLVSTIAGSCSWSPDGEWIAFDTTRDGSSRIYIINADAKNTYALTDGSQREALPAWSPDGIWIAFQAGGNIYRMHSDRTGEERLTNNSTNDQFAAWSPDGTQIVFVSGEGNAAEIYVMNADGSNQHPLTNNEAEDVFPDWSPDSKQIVFTSKRDGSSQIYIMNVDGSGIKRLTHPSTGSNDYPSWSPDGTRIAFDSSRSGNWGLYIMNRDGSNQTRLSPNDGAGYFAPCWRPIPGY